jgi:hypothetical protein
VSKALPRGPIFPVTDSISGMTKFRSLSQFKQLGKTSAFWSSEVSSEGVFKLSALSGTPRYRFPWHTQHTSPEKLSDQYRLDLY